MVESVSVLDVLERDDGVLLVVAEAEAAEVVDIVAEDELEGTKAKAAVTGRCRSGEAMSLLVVFKADPIPI